MSLLPIGCCPGFDDSAWKNGLSPFGGNQRTSKTLWKSRHIWVRRIFNVQNLDLKELLLKLKHDDNVWVYLNGQLIYEKSCCAGRFAFLELDKQLKANLQKGNNLLALHVENTSGNGHFDVGIVEKIIPESSKDIKEAKQKSVVLNATQTIYEFECGKTDLTLTFTSPLLINELEVLARPVSYISAKVKSNDGKTHQVKIYLGASSNIAVNTEGQEVTAEKYTKDKLKILKTGTVEQLILKKKVMTCV